jgi:hypothetical protein
VLQIACAACESAAEGSVRTVLETIFAFLSTNGEHRGQLVTGISEHSGSYLERRSVLSAQVTASNPALFRSSSSQRLKGAAARVKHAFRLTTGRSQRIVERGKKEAARKASRASLATLLSEQTVDSAARREFGGSEARSRLSAQFGMDQLHVTVPSVSASTESALRMDHGAAGASMTPPLREFRLFDALDAREKGYLMFRVQKKLQPPMLPHAMSSATDPYPQRQPTRRFRLYTPIRVHTLTLR